jgi:hypothetical protein
MSNLFPSFALGQTFELPQLTPANVSLACRVAAAGCAAYGLYRVFFAPLGHDAGEPGSLFLAFGSRRVFDQVCDKRTDPYYLDLESEPWAKEIEGKWTIIRDELQQYLDAQGGTLRPFGHTHRMSSAHCWRVLSLMLWRVRDPRAAEHFPKTLALLQKAVPADRLVGITFSQLEPESNIAPHVGDTNGNYRCHLGLIVPRGLPDAGLEVGGEQRAWEEGRMFAFNDAHHHRAWNNAPKHRFILILDVMRKEHKEHTNEVCCHVMASFLLQRLSNKMPLLKSGKRVEANVHAILKRLVTVPIILGVGQGFVHRIMQA